MNLHLTRFTNHAFLRIEGKIHANKQDSGEQIVFHIQNTPQFTSFQSITHQAQSSILKKRHTRKRVIKGMQYSTAPSGQRGTLVMEKSNRT